MNGFFVGLVPTDTAQRAAEMMKAEGVGIVCVCGIEKLPLGVVTDRDLALRVCAEGLSPGDVPLHAIMTGEPVTCHLDTPIAEIERLMTHHTVGRVLVVDDRGILCGVISLAEIWHHESPLTAGALSRMVTERELRATPTGGHFDSGRPSKASEPPDGHA